MQYRLRGGRAEISRQILAMLAEKSPQTIRTITNEKRAGIWQMLSAEQVLV